MTGTELVPIAEIATRLGMDRSHARRYAKKHGFAFLRIRTPQSRGQQTLALREEDVQVLQEIRNREGFAPSGSSRACPANGGWFYIVRLIPDLAPNRIKLGFAVDVQRRLAAHRTSAPTADLVESWPCQPVWEQAAIDSITREGCRCIGGEVYEVDNVGRIVERGEQFFSIMPSHKGEEF